MRTPRDLSGQELAARLQILGYKVTRQNGSHIRLTSDLKQQHHVTIPAHNPLRIGTLNAILNEVATHHGLTRAELLEQLF